MRGPNMDSKSDNQTKIITNIHRKGPTIPKMNKSNLQNPINLRQ